MLDAQEVLKKLKIEKRGKYENKFYVIDLESSNEYAKMYTVLSDNAINTEFPNIETNTNGSTTKIVNYFEIEAGKTAYNIFLIANFIDDKYYIRIGEK